MMIHQTFHSSCLCRDALIALKAMPLVETRSSFARHRDVVLQPQVMINYRSCHDATA